MNTFPLDFDPLLPTAIVTSVMIAARLIGWRMGQSLRTQRESLPESKWDDVALALLGLLLAFSFGVSMSKHDQRRIMAVADSNAIGDFYNCASLLKDPQRTKLQNVIREYTQARLGLARRPPDEATPQQALKSFDKMHRQMTDLVAQAVAAGTPIAVSLANTLNAVTSTQTSRLAAYRDRLSPSIALLLLVSSIVAALLVGREQGASNQAQLVATLSFILVVSLTVYVILDLNQPEAGLIRVSQESMEQLLSSMSR